ncbi:hypothetical protein AWENTII_003669 [Aspergillus wentii]|nr:hypothetical protein MW887_011689 [Aspergillus wentii]
MVVNTTNGPPAVPSRNALRVLRKLALAGSTVGSFCTVAAITYDVHRRVRVAESIIENKRALQTSAPNYDATYAARRMSRMMKAAEDGEFMGLESFKEQDRKSRNSQNPQQEDQIGVSEKETDSSAVVDVSASLERAESFLESARSQLIGTLDPRRHPSQASGRSSFLPPEPMRTPNPLKRSKTRFGQSDADTKPENSTTSPDPEIQEQSSVLRQMQELLENDRPIEAAQLFLESHPASLERIPSDRKELAVQIFYMNCRQGNVFIARNIFERLEEVDSIDTKMWESLMFSLAKKGSIESVATIYTRYMRKFSVSDDMVDVVLRSLLESHRLTTAKWFLLRNLRVDRNSGLSGAYLTGLWKKTRSIELLNGQLKKLLRVHRAMGKEFSEKLFNPVVKAYVEFGRVADAEALVEDMKTNFNIPPRCRTKGLLLYGKALACDWEEVELGLQEMYDLGMTQRRRDFTPIFDRIFLEYWVSHSGTQIRDFVFKCIDKFNIVPDRVLYKHILEAFVEKGDRDMIFELTDMARERSWKIPIKEEEFLETLRRRRHALEGAPVGFWHMLQAARIKHGQAATSQRILGYDQQSFPIDEVNKMPFTQSTLPWHQRTLQEGSSSKPVDQYQMLHKRMSHFMHVGKMTEALKCYQHAKNAKFQMKQHHVELGVIATLLEHGLEAARALIDAEWRYLRDSVRFFPIFFRQLTEMSSTSEEEAIKLAVLRFYELCSTNKKLTVKHHMTVATTRRLIATQKPQMAIDLLSAVYMSRYRNSADFDGVCMKMFVRAFAEMENLRGIRWCALTGLSHSDASGRDFVVEVRRVVGVLSRRLGASVSSSPKDAANTTEQLEYLDLIAELLEKKSQGDPLMWELRPDPIKKRLSRRKLKQPVDEKYLFRQSNIRETIEGWDEEYELEAVLGRLDNITAPVTVE